MQTYEVTTKDQLVLLFGRTFANHEYGKVYSIRAKHGNTEIHLNSNDKTSIYRTLQYLFPIINSRITIQMWG